MQGAFAQTGVILPIYTHMYLTVRFFKGYIVIVTIFYGQRRKNHLNHTRLKAVLFCVIMIAKI